MSAVGLGIYDRIVNARHSLSVPSFATFGLHCDREFSVSSTNSRSRLGAVIARVRADM